jgi:hypothetical protein
MEPRYEPYWSNYLNRFMDVSSNIFQEIPDKTDKFCVIVEPRCHSLLESVLKNFMVMLAPKGWGLIIYHGTTNEDFVKEITSQWKNIYLRNIGVDNLTSNQYSNLFFSSDFWSSMKDVGCKHALIFQTDVVLLRDTIEDFLEYDYIGSPWNTGLSWTRGIKYPGGNGGFSLRNVDTMLECISTLPPNPSLNEDMYFTLACTRLGKKMPSYEVSSKFAVESVFYEKPCGLHRPHLSFFPPDGLKHIFDLVN